MAALIVRKLDDKVVAALKKRAAKNGVSVEEEHRRILRQALIPRRQPKPDFKKFLSGPPYFDAVLVRAINERTKLSSS